MDALLQGRLDHVATCGFAFERRQHQWLLLPPDARTEMIGVDGDDDFLLLKRPVRADGMQTKNIVNRIVENQGQKVERDDAAQRSGERVAERLQIGVPGDRLREIEERLIDFRIRELHTEDANSRRRNRQLTL